MRTSTVEITTHDVEVTVEDVQRGDRLQYEPALRVIGRQLDAEPTYHISLTEVLDGFNVRAQPSQLRTDARLVRFTWDRLYDLIVYHAAGRGCARRSPRHRGIWANFPNGHEDFFRALGHELDAISANSLSVEETPEGVEVTYMRPRANGDLQEKTHRVLSYVDVEAMLVDARDRRTRQTQQTAG